MKPIKRILVPTDFSERASTAYSYAELIAKISGARIDTIHVVPMMKYFHESMKNIGAPMDMERELYPHVIEETQNQLEELMREQFDEDTRGKYEVRVDRKPSEAIVEQALNKKYDLVVMGTQGHHRSEILRGSITEKVIRHSEVPVLTVPEPIHGEDGIRHIMMPTDTSRVSLLSLPLTVQLADLFNADITLFHVIELYGTLSENIPHDPSVDEMDAIYERLMDTVNEYLPSHSEGHMSLRRGEEKYSDTIVYRPKDGLEKTIPVKTKLLKGVSAHYDIEDYARDKMDLIVMTTHGRSGLAHLLLGSTTEQVARHVAMPVLTVRPRKHQINPEHQSR